MKSVSRREAIRAGAGALAAGLTGFSVSGALTATHPVIDPAEALFFEHQSNVEPKSVAAIITVYFHNSHADVLLTKILEGWKHDGGPGPALKLASIYIDQPEGSAFGLEILEKHGIRRFNTIEEALTLGGNSIEVDGVLSIGEHGNYPVNDLGQQLYPRKRFFEEITNAFEKYGRVVPVFNDKHISTVWEEALWMYNRSKELKVPFMSGSSLPLTYRTHDVQIPMNAEVESAVGIGYSGLDIYGFHALECYQTLLERRRHGTIGVRSVRCAVGADAWEAIDNGWIPQDVAEAAYEVIPKSKKSIREDESPVLFLMTYADDFHGALFMLQSALLTGVAVKVKDQPVMATGFEERPEPRYPHFAYLLKAIEAMIHSGVPSYPVERTLLTGGILDRALLSKSMGGKHIETPELMISYKPADYPHAPAPDLLKPPKTTKSR